MHDMLSYSVATFIISSIVLVPNQIHCTQCKNDKIQSNCKKTIRNGVFRVNTVWKMIFFDGLYYSTWTDIHTSVQMGIYVLNALFGFDLIACHHPKRMKFFHVCLHAGNLSAIFLTRNEWYIFKPSIMMKYYGCFVLL